MIALAVTDWVVIGVLFAVIVAVLAVEIWWRSRG